MSNFLVLADQRSTVLAWLQAIEELDKRSKEAYNLVYTITKPDILNVGDLAAVRKFNQLAGNLNLHSTETVANTIFPLDTYRSKGSVEFYEYYLEVILPKVRKRWGTYFERMITRRNDDGSLMMKDGVRLNPLARLIDKLDRRVKGTARTTTHYEMGVDDLSFEIAAFDPLRDGSFQVGGPCLSHLSFKVDGQGALRLTAFYRSHYYVGRALGNLIGLARLQTFVARSVGLSVGPLTIIAAEAVLDVTAGNRGAAQTRQMLKACRIAWQGGVDRA